MKLFRIVPAVATMLLLSQCQTDPKTPTVPGKPTTPPKPAREWKRPAETGFHMIPKKKRDSLINSSEINSEILTAINRTDLAHLKQMDSIVVPQDFQGDK